MRHQYNDNVHGMIAGIGLVTCVYFNPETDQLWLLDYYLFAPKANGKITLNPVADMLAHLAPRGIACRTVLIDSWYATTALFKWLLQEQETSYCLLKSNRLVDDSGGQQSYQPVACLSWSLRRQNGGNRESKSHAQVLQAETLEHTDSHPPDGLPPDQRGWAPRYGHCRTRKQRPLDR